MGIGDGQGLQHPLHAAVLAPGAVQGVEGGVRLDPRQDLGHVAPGVHFADLGAQSSQGVGAGLARHQRYVAFRRKAAHQDGDVAAGEGQGHGRLRERRSALNGC